LVRQDDAWIDATDTLSQVFKGGLGAPRGTAADDDQANPVRAMWRRDSVLTGHALSSIIADDEYFTAAAAKSAAAWYRVLSGRAAPVLQELELEGAPRTRDDIAFNAIERLDTPAEEALVFRRACDAGWQLIHLRRDRAYAAWAWSRGDLAWPFAARIVLIEATRLLAGTAFSAPMAQLWESALPPDSR
jgi:hypothetical protein